MSKRTVLVGLFVGFLFALLAGRGSASSALLASGVLAGALAVAGVTRLPVVQ